MRWLRRLVVIIVLLSVLGFGLLFCLQNTDAVPLDLLVAQLTARPLAVWVLGAFILGGVLGVVVGSAALVRLQASRFRLRRRLENCERELSELRTLAPKR